MIGLIYQHHRSIEKLFHCLDNLKEMLVQPNLYVVSLVLDNAYSAREVGLVEKKLKELGCKCNLEAFGTNKGLTVARNKATLNCTEFHCDRYLHCFTTSIWLRHLDKELHDSIVNDPSNLSAFPFDNEDWLFPRNENLTGIGEIPIGTFFNTPSKPDYLMSFRRGILDKEYPNERYTPEDVMWYQSSKGYINMRSEVLALNWFEDDGMTKSTMHSMREVELNNPEAFYQRARFFIKEFLEGKVALTQRQLKDYLSTLVSNPIHPIPFKELEGTFIYPLLLQRISDWGLNRGRKNEFGLRKETENDTEDI